MEHEVKQEELKKKVAAVTQTEDTEARIQKAEKHRQVPNEKQRLRHANQIIARRVRVQ